MTTSTSTKLLLILGLTLLLTGLATASHRTGSIVDGGADYSEFDNLEGYGIPSFSSHAEIVTYLVAPFLFVTLLLQIALNQVLKHTVAKGSAPGDGPDTSKFATIMALSITAMLVPSPFWDYIILSGNLIGVISVTILLLVFIAIFRWVSSGTSRTRRDRYRVQ